MKANELHYFSDLFDKVLYMLQTCPLSIIRSISTLYTQQYVFATLVLLASASVTMVVDTNRTSMTNTYCYVYSVEILLMMDSGHV